MKFARFAWFELQPKSLPKLNIIREYLTKYAWPRIVVDNCLVKAAEKRHLLNFEARALESVRNYLPDLFISLFYFSVFYYWINLSVRVLFLRSYYFHTENIWLDGYLFDFLQKKTADSWLRNYVVLTGFLFSERLVFDSIIRLYVDFFVAAVQSYTLFEPSNISSILNITIFTYFSLFVVLMLSLVTVF